MLDPQLVADTKRHEGLRLRTYLDTKGIPTIGYGTNLLELEIDEPLAALWLTLKLEAAQRTALGIAGYSVLSQPRKNVIVEMVYNMGRPRLMGFHKMLDALAVGDYPRVSAEMLDSKWHNVDVGDPEPNNDRAEYLADIMLTGAYRDSRRGGSDA